MIDSLYLANDTLCTSAIHITGEECICPSWLDYSEKIATIVIGFVNICFAIYVFWFNNKLYKQKDKEESLKYKLHSFILKYKLEEFYNTFDTLYEKSKKIIDTQNVEDEKKIFEEECQDSLSAFRLRFLECLSAIDENLYNESIKCVDELQTALSTNLFDEGVNINVQKKHDELIKTPIYNCQNKILKLLSEFK